MPVDPMSAAVALNRDTDVTPLRFEPPLIPLLDQAHCVAWEAELNKHATAWEVRKATSDLWQQIPAVPGLYMFVWRPPLHFTMEGSQPHSFSWLIYCGLAGAKDSANTLKARYRGEYAKYLRGDPSAIFAKAPVAGRVGSLRRWLLLQPLEYWWAEVNDTDRLVELEKQIIRLLAPPLNTQHRKLRPKEGTRRPAFSD